ncbi:hypothetical protein [Halostagnicola bangensis]
MTSRHPCPLCTDAFENERRLTVHLEVEHRKSELVTYLVDDQATSSESVTEPENETHIDTRPTPPL